jgi:hypothetical protein
VIPELVKESFLVLTGRKVHEGVRDILLLECTDASSGLPVNMICFAIQGEDGVKAVPVAVMVSPDIIQTLRPPNLENLVVEGEQPKGDAK